MQQLVNKKTAELKTEDDTFYCESREDYLPFCQPIVIKFTICSLCHVFLFLQFMVGKLDEMDKKTFSFL